MYTGGCYIAISNCFQDVETCMNQPRTHMDWATASLSIGRYTRIVWVWIATGILETCKPACMIIGIDIAIYTVYLHILRINFTVSYYLAVPSFLERGVTSIIPLSVLQTQVSLLPGAKGHLVPVGWATEGTTSTNANPNNTLSINILTLWLHWICRAKPKGFVYHTPIAFIVQRQGITWPTCIVLHQ